MEGTFLLCFGVKKSIVLNSANLTAQKVGGNREHGSDFELNCRLVIELASAANSTAATYEHASPSPAIHIQCPQRTSLSIAMTSQTFNGTDDKL